MKYLVVVSQKNQARRFKLFLTASEAGKVVFERIGSNVEILFLDWGNSEQEISSELTELAALLSDAPITRITLPGATQVFTKLRHRDFTTIYSRFLESRAELSEAFMFSYEGHYSLLATMLVKARVKTNLVEEGLGTYVHAWDNARVIVPGFVGTVIQAVRAFIGPLVFNDARSSPLNLLKRMARELFWGAFGPKVPNQKELTSGYRDFDTFYTSFPELAKEVFPKAEHIFTPFAIAMLGDSPEARAKIDQLDFAPGDAIFLGQTYSFTEQDHVAILTRALNLTEGVLWIKTHPRLDPEALEVLTRASQLVSASRIRFFETDQSGEFLIWRLKPKTVISLTSTSLTYVEQISPESECFSLADFALGLLADSSERGYRRTHKVLAADSAVLGYFPKIRLSQESDVKR